jgi:hypothetical protein
MTDVVVAVADGRAAGRQGQHHGGSPSSTAPCAACKFLRRRCPPECVFAPYFPSSEPHRFACVHKVFGASNISKLIQVRPTSNAVPPHYPIVSQCYSVPSLLTMFRV